MTDEKEAVLSGRKKLTKDEKKLLGRLRRQAGYHKKSADEKSKLDAELTVIAKRSLERKSDETAFAKNVAVAAKHEKRVYFKTRWRALTLFVTASFVLLLTLYVLYAYVFVVASVEVTGNERYTAEAIAAASGIAVGDKMYELPTDEAGLSAELTKRFPYIKSVEMKRVIPDRIVITVTEETAVFVSEIYGEYALLSEELRVLELAEVKPAGEYIKLVLPEVKNAIEGEPIEFKADMFDVAEKAAEAVCADSMRAGTSVLDISDRFNIRIAFEDRYRIVIGDINDIELKLTLAFEIMKDEVFDGGNKGTIYLENVSSPSVIIDNSITFE